MGFDIKLSDSQFPVSPVFIEFLHYHFTGKDYNYKWDDQLNENLSSAAYNTQSTANSALNLLIQNPEARDAIMRSYQYMISLLIGDLKLLREFQNKYKFICTLGVPRTGGSYLTKQLYNSLGLAEKKVPSSIAHDGFPSCVPFKLADSYNSYTNMLKHLSEFMVMVEMYCKNFPIHENRIIVPKKSFRMSQYAALFNEIFGKLSEYIITIRHPISACISSYEKSGGFPEDGQFTVRSNIEDIIRQDLEFIGYDEKIIRKTNYIDVYVLYWEYYYSHVFLTGLMRNKNIRVVPFEKESMHGMANSYFARFNSCSRPDEFYVKNYQDLHSAYRKKSENAIRRVSHTWALVGMDFPTAQILDFY